MTKLDRLRGAAGKAAVESSKPQFRWPERERLHYLCTSQTVLALLDAVEALRITRGQWIHSANADRCLSALAALDKEDGE